MDRQAVKRKSTVVSKDYRKRVWLLMEQKAEMAERIEALSHELRLTEEEVRQYKGRVARLAVFLSANVVVTIVVAFLAIWGRICQW